MTRTIPALPAQIRQPPASLIAPDDPDRDEKRAHWRAWREGVLRYRVKRAMDLKDQPEAQRIEMALCARDPAYWLLMWGVIFEPRPQRDRSPDSPFIPFPFQIDMLDWFDERLESTGATADGVVSKSRDMGASWLAVAWALHGWLFRNPWQVRMVSWRADEVDARSPDSLFWKLDYMLFRLPEWMRPEGFEPTDHRLKMTLVNPATNNTITGQASTSRAMSGSRAGVIIYDEGAKNERLQESWSGTTNVAKTRIAVSSEHLDYTPFFYQLGIGYTGPPDDRPALLEVDYYLHPDHDDDWLADQRARNASTPGAFEREVLRDPKAGDTTFVYPSASAKQTVACRYVPGAPLFVGIDPGHADETAIVWMQQQPDGRMKLLEAYQAKGKTANFWGTILRGTPHLRIKSWGDTDDPGTPVGLTPTESDPDTWEYTEREYELMQWTQKLPRATYFGDVSGHNTLGASKDTVYSRLARFGINVNVDRDRNGKAQAWKMQARTFKGRQEALKELLPRLDFANTWGGQLALSAVQNYRWSGDNRPRQAEPRTPLHDSSSHLCSAIEYVAVNLFLRRQIGEAYASRDRNLTASPDLAYASMGVSRG